MALKTCSSPLKIVMSYDIICPHSFVAYQVLQKKLIDWRKKREIIVEYKPAIHPRIHRMAYGVMPGGLITTKKDYLINELKEICDFYNIPKGDFEISYKLLQKRSIAALFLLVLFKNKLPEFYEKYMCAMWKELWYKNGNVNCTNVFLKLGRELGIPFSTMSYNVMLTEQPANVRELLNYTIFLVEQERILSCPWFIATMNNGRKIFASGEILRLELLSELIEKDDESLEKLQIEENFYPTDDEFDAQKCLYNTNRTEMEKEIRC